MNRQIIDILAIPGSLRRCSVNGTVDLSQSPTVRPLSNPIG
jgi:hypothetical protein